MTTIHVTQEYINKGQPDNDFHCPVRYAMLSHGFTVTSVRSAYIYFGRPDATSGNKIATPQKVKQWLEAFDEGNPVSPFTFEIDL